MTVTRKKNLSIPFFHSLLLLGWVEVDTSNTSKSPPSSLTPSPVLLHHRLFPHQWKRFITFGRINYPCMALQGDTCMCFCRSNREREKKREYKLKKRREKTPPIYSLRLLFAFNAHVHIWSAGFVRGVKRMQGCCRGIQLAPLLLHTVYIRSTLPLAELIEMYVLKTRLNLHCSYNLTQFLDCWKCVCGVSTDQTAGAGVVYCKYSSHRHMDATGWYHGPSTPRWGRHH